MLLQLKKELFRNFYSIFLWRLRLQLWLQFTVNLWWYNYD